MQKFFKWFVCVSFLCFAPAQLSLAGDVPTTQTTKQKKKKKTKKPAVDAAKQNNKEQSKKAVTGTTGKKTKKLNQQMAAKTGYQGGAAIDGPEPETRPSQVDLKSGPSSATILTSLFAVISFLVWPLIIVGILMLVSGWKIFVKAGREGWESIVPILNIFRYIQIARMPIWSIAMFFLPMLNMIFPFWMSFALAKAFNKSTGFALGLVFLPFVFYPILAFGDSTYGNQYNPQTLAGGFSMAS